MDYKKMYCGETELDILVRQKTQDGWKMFAHEHPKDNTLIDIILIDGTEIKNVLFQQKHLYKDEKVIGTCAISRFWK